MPEGFIFDFVDVYGERPDDRVDVTVKHTVLSNLIQARDHSTKKRLKIDGTDFSQGGRYSVQIMPMRHRPVARFIRALEDRRVQQTFVLAVDPDRVKRVEFPDFADLGSDLKDVLNNSKVEGSESLSGQSLYDSFDDLQQAGLLNLYAKMKATRFLNGRDVFSFVTAFRRVRGERFFADVQRELRDEVKNSVLNSLFNEVSGALHTPPPGFKPDDSFKTEERHGNLQLTFFVKPETLDFRIDADIDNSQGLEHVFDVISHAITRRDTHPYDVHALLLGGQKIDPGYKLVI